MWGVRWCTIRFCRALDLTIRRGIDRASAYVTWLLGRCELTSHTIRSNQQQSYYSTTVQYTEHCTTTSIAHLSVFCNLVRPAARVIKSSLRKIRYRNPKSFVIEEVPRLLCKWFEVQAYVGDVVSHYPIAHGYRITYLQTWKTDFCRPWNLGGRSFRACFHLLIDIDVGDEILYFLLVPLQSCLAWPPRWPLCSSRFVHRWQGSMLPTRCQGSVRSN